MFIYDELNYILIEETLRITCPVRSRKPLRNYLVRHNPLWLKPLIV